MVISCQDINFNPALSQDRINKASKIFGAAVIRRIICFSLFLLGATRVSIAKLIEMPTDSVKTLIKNLHNNGIPAFEDRRRHSSTFLPQEQKKSLLKVSVILERKWICIDFGKELQKIKIPRNNKLQIRSFLLTMLNSGLLSTKQTSELLELSNVQTRVLAKTLQEEDMVSLLDQRQGQKKDYVFKPEIKAEMIQQYVVDIITEKRASSRRLSENIKERCNLDLSSRTIRFHIDKLGLSKIRQTLPKLIGSIKKNSRT